MNFDKTKLQQKPFKRGHVFHQVITSIHKITTVDRSVSFGEPFFTTINMR